MPLLSSPVSEKAAPKKIAIVGAGIAGASAAFNLYRWAGPDVNITIFERDDRVGGRIKSFNSGEPYPIEVGTPWFSGGDKCLLELQEITGLRRLGLVRHDVGVYDGDGFIYLDKAVEPPWRRSLRMWWRYGRSLSIFGKMVSEYGDRLEAILMGRLQTLWSDLYYHDLMEPVLDNATWHLRNLNSRFINEIVRPHARIRGQELDEVNGLTAVTWGKWAQGVAERSNYWALLKGNEELVRRVVGLSQAEVRLGHEVLALMVDEYKYTVHYALPDGSAEAEAFDIVILTTSLESGNATSHVERHVTHFYSTSPLDPRLFGQDAEFILPDEILTAPQNEFDLFSSGNEVYSIKRPNFAYLWEPPIDPGPPQDKQFMVQPYKTPVYEIISSAPVRDVDIARLIGKDIYNGTLWDIGVSWVNRQAWPQAFPSLKKPPLDGPKLWFDLYVIAGAENVMASAEVSCGMGRKVASVYMDRNKP